MAFASLAARRGFLRLIGFAPVAVPVGIKEAAAALASSPVVQAAAALNAAPIPDDNVTQRFGKTVADQLRDMVSAMSMEEFAERQVAVDGIDPDLACLKSTSRCWKANKMKQRYRERHEVGRAIKKIVWPGST